MKATSWIALSVIGLYVLTLAGLVFVFLNISMTGASVYLASWIVYSVVTIAFSRKLVEEDAAKIAKGSVSIFRWNAILFELVLFVLIFSDDSAVGGAVLAVYLVFGFILNPFSFRKLTPAILRSGRKARA